MKLILSRAGFHEGFGVLLVKISATANEDKDTIEDVYEPFLICEGLLKKIRVEKSFS